MSQLVNMEQSLLLSGCRTGRHMRGVKKNLAPIFIDQSKYFMLDAITEIPSSEAQLINTEYTLRN